MPARVGENLRGVSATHVNTSSRNVHDPVGIAHPEARLQDDIVECIPRGGHGRIEVRENQRNLPAFLFEAPTNNESFEPRR